MANLRGILNGSSHLHVMLLALLLALLLLLVQGDASMLGWLR